MKRAKKHVILLIILMVAFYSLSVTDSYTVILKNKTFMHYSLYPTLILQFIIYSIAGMLFGAEGLYIEIFKNGSWKINLSRLLILGIPSFILGVYFLLYFAFTLIPPAISLIFINHPMFVNLMQMLFGYTLITSIYKSER